MSVSKQPGLSSAVGVAFTQSPAGRSNQFFTFNLAGYITTPTTALAVGDTICLEFRARPSTNLRAVVWNNTGGSVNRVFINANNGIMTSSFWGATLLDGIPYASQDVADSEWHILELVADATSVDFGSIGATPTGVFPAELMEIRNVRLKRAAPSASNPDRYWPINDGFLVDPVIRDVLGDGSTDGTAILFDANGWS